MDRPVILQRLERYIAPVLFFIPFLFFAHVLGYGFIDLDDSTQIVENLLIRNLSWNNTGYLFTHFHFGDYKPLTLLSHALELHVWGLDAYGFHLTNLVLHASNGLLLYWLLRALRLSLGTALAVSLIFMLHPVQTEVFIWIAAREHLLSTFFFLTAFIFHTLWRRDRLKIYGFISFIGFILAFLVKEISLVFPLLTLAYDYLFSTGSPGDRLHQYQNRYGYVPPRTASVYS